MVMNPAKRCPTYPTAMGAATYDQRAFPHNPDLVTVIRRQRAHKGARINLVTPFAGKPLMAEYMRGLDKLPLDQCHAVLYDNSNNPHFRKKVEAVANRFRSATIIEDRNQPYTVENARDYGLITLRAHAIYQELYENQIDKRLPLCLNIEDDTEPPAGAFEQLLQDLERDPKVATAAGVQCSRRMQDQHHTEPMVWSFEETRPVGSFGPATVTAQRIVTPKPIGCEPVGATGTGLWLTKTKIIEEVGMRFDVNNLAMGHDLAWGYHVNVAGYYYLVDWGVVARHWGFYNNRKIAV